MAIKIIKHGAKTFKAVCPVCGCEFEYEYEDLKKEYGFVKFVLCPDCGEMIYHHDFKEPKAPDLEPWNPITKPYITWEHPYVGGWDGDQPYDCEKCINKPDPNKIVVGDTPCTWCKKNLPYCTSAVNLDTKSVTTYATTITDSDKAASCSYTIAEGKTNE
jgi:hypothetical protein